MPTRALVRSDPTLLERILRNLVSNAVRYTNAGGVIVGCSRSGDGSLRIAVCDSGIGIAREQLPQIFKEFFQIALYVPSSLDGASAGLSNPVGIVQISQ